MHNNIQSFLKIKERCIFCQEPLRAVLSSFMERSSRRLEPFSFPIIDNKVTFNIDKETEKVSISGYGTIDIITNSLKVSPNNRLDLSTFDDKRKELFSYAEEFFMQEAFSEQTPYIGLQCCNKKCKLKYTLDSNVIKVGINHKNNSWYIKPFLLYQETFTTKNLLVQNDWIRGATNIFALNNITCETKPLKIPMMDFESMDKKKLINRIKTLVTFS